MILNSHKFSTTSFFIHFFNSLINSSGKMNVQLSTRGKKLLNNKELAAKVIDRIIIDHKKLDRGENIIINDESSNKSIKVSMVSSKFDVKAG